MDLSSVPLASRLCFETSFIRLVSSLLNHLLFSSFESRLLLPLYHQLTCNPDSSSRHPSLTCSHHSPHSLSVQQLPVSLLHLFLTSSPIFPTHLQSDDFWFSRLHFPSFLFSRFPIMSNLQEKNIQQTVSLTTLTHLRQSAPANFSMFSMSRPCHTYPISLCHHIYLPLSQIPVPPTPHLSSCRL